MSLVNKQYNSPINLYSPQNVQEVLEREKKVLANGAVGIDFHHLPKPGNLANSAVLRMLEEEERMGQNGQKLKRVAWPPPAEPNNNNLELEQQEPIYAKAPVLPNYQESPYSPPSQVSPINNFSPQPNKTLNLQQATSPKGWAPVHSPVLTPLQPSFQTTPLYKSPTPPLARPSGLLTLRKEPPIHQKAAPVFASQPATATLNGGANMRGDQKWPPATVKAQAEEENRARMELAKGPACRPRRPNRDYSGFFAKHALNSTYPGYRAPPGTQHYFEEHQYPGQSNL